MPTATELPQVPSPTTNNTSLSEHKTEINKQVKQKADSSNSSQLQKDVYSGDNNPPNTPPTQTSNNIRNKEEETDIIDSINSTINKADFSTTPTINVDDVGNETTGKAGEKYPGHVEELKGNGSGGREEAKTEQFKVEMKNLKNVIQEKDSFIEILSAKLKTSHKKVEAVVLGGLKLEFLN